MQPGQSPGCAKVGNLDTTVICVNENVVTLDISVNNLVVMEIPHTVHNLSGIVLDCGLVQWPPLVT